jgi:hypothetical protein
MTNKETIEVINRSHDDIKTIIDINQKLTTAEIGALADLMKIQFNQVKLKQDITNNNVGHNTEDIKENAEKIKKTEDALKPQKWIGKHWKATVLIILFAMYLTYSLFDIYSLSDIINALK